MYKLISVSLIIALFFSCKKKDELYITDFSNLNGWTTYINYNTNVVGDTAWVAINNNQLTLTAIHKEASSQINYASATYDFSHWVIDMNGTYIFEIGVVSPGFFSGEPDAVSISIQFDTWVFSCKPYSGQTMTNEKIKIQLDLANHTHVVTRLSDNEDLSSTFDFYENTFVDPSYKIRLGVKAGSYMDQYDNSLGAKYDFLRISKAKD